MHIVSHTRVCVSVHGRVHMFTCMCVLTRAPAYVGVCTVTRKCATCLWLPGWGLKGPRETTRELGLPEGAGAKTLSRMTGCRAGRPVASGGQW